MFQRLTDRGDVDKEHIIELESGKAKLFFLKENKSENALVRVKNLLLDSYEQRVHNNKKYTSAHYCILCRITVK